MKTKAELRSEYVNEAINFLQTHAPIAEAAREHLSSFNTSDVHWSNTCRFAKCRHEPTEYYLKQVANDEKRQYSSNREKPIRIDEGRKVWITYDRKTVGRRADNIKCTERLATVTSLIHEMTHMIQIAEGRQMSEVETTENEMAYVKEHHPYIYKKTVSTAA